MFFTFNSDKICKFASKSENSNEQLRKVKDFIEYVKYESSTIQPL